MKVVVQIVEKVYQEAHLEIPDGLTEEGIKQVAIRKSQVASVKKSSAEHKTLSLLCSASNPYFQPPRSVRDITCDLRLVTCDLEMTPDLNIFQVEFESISATIVQQPQEAV